MTDTGKFWALPEAQQFIGMNNKINGLLTNIFQHQCARKRANKFTIPSGHRVGYDYLATPNTNNVWKFLEYQGWTEKQITGFGNNLSKVVSGGNKKNTMYLWGVSNAGKTTLAMNFVKNFFEGAVGRPLNQVRSSFRFQDCINKAVILWEEPQLIKDEIEDCKLLFGGQEVPANVKYQGSVAVPSTPVIVTANQSVERLMWTGFGDDVWKNRVYSYYFGKPLIEKTMHELFDKMDKNMWYDYLYICKHRDQEMEEVAKAIMEQDLFNPMTELPPLETSSKKTRTE